MNAKKAKKLRRLAYQDAATNNRGYKVMATGEIRADDRRRLYKAAKHAHKTGNRCFIDGHDWPRGAPPGFPVECRRCGIRAPAVKVVTEEEAMG